MKHDAQSLPWSVQPHQKKQLTAFDEKPLIRQRETVAVAIDHQESYDQDQSEQEESEVADWIHRLAMNAKHSCPVVASA